MTRLLLLSSFLLLGFSAVADSTFVKNIDELNAAAKKAKPGDKIVLQNGEWKNVSIKLETNGTKDNPILFKAQSAGKVIITGNSQLRIGGSYTIVDGLYFKNGYAGKDDFNNPKRMDENNWVLFYGKNNRLDHCSFKDKKNMGVLVAVILDDERSRENFHSIDHNYFGKRPPLASNGGEIIRVGVSQHCQFNSNTQIIDNLFEHCDGETEIVSIKSGSNVVRNNVFKESQGSVVLRHGDNNTVENNLFLGNGKTATGGVRVINKGQWVVNNFFYKCRGTDFRSPLSIMNGIPNSPAHRYVQVTDAVIANNTFVDCSPISFCEGSDAERTLPPANVLLANNLFYNSTDSIVYNVYDAINGFTFSGNEVSSTIKQKLAKGFVQTSFSVQKNDNKPFPVSNSKNNLAAKDSIQKIAATRLSLPLSAQPGFSNLNLIKQIQANAYSCGAKWFTAFNNDTKPIAKNVKCSNATEVYAELEHNNPVIIELTGSVYNLTKPFSITKPVKFTTKQTRPIQFVTPGMLAAFVLSGNGNLSLNSLASDSSGYSNHYNLIVRNCSISQFSAAIGCNNFFYAHKSMIADSIMILNNVFNDNQCNMINMAEEKEDKGYYNTERIMISNNKFNNNSGTLLNIYRGGNDESTLGPNLAFSNNKLGNCNTGNGSALINLTGVQVSQFVLNIFSSCNTSNTLIQFKDIVRARHLVEKNVFEQSGTISKNQFVVEKANVRR